MSDNKYFSDEYLPESSTEDSISDKVEQESKCDTSFEIEQSKYGESKPKRIIIKAKIIDG